jgi:hypothetical protein
MPGKVKFELKGARKFEYLLKELGSVPAGRLGTNAAPGKRCESLGAPSI